MNALNESVLRSFPAVHQAALDALLADALAADPHKLVVLDDDPTGTQTVHDVSVFTDWTTESVREGFAEDSRLFFILTNSRGMTEKETAVVHREIAQTVAAVSRVVGQICPSVPVWRTGAESRFPQTPFVIFPGNTGSTTTLREVVEILTCTKGN